MRTVLFLMAGAFAQSLAACGYKGNLKTPTQIEQEEAKKAHEEQKKKEEEKK